MDTARYTQVWLKISAARKALKADYDAADKVLSDQQKVLEGVMLGFLSDSNQAVSTNEFGKFSRKVDLKPSAEDWPAIYAWIKQDDDRWELLHKRLGKTFVERYAEDHEGALPPGVKVYREYVLHVAPRAPPN